MGPLMPATQSLGSDTGQVTPGMTSTHPPCIHSHGRIQVASAPYMGGTPLHPPQVPHHAAGIAPVHRGRPGRSEGLG